MSDMLFARAEAVWPNNVHMVLLERYRHTKDDLLVLDGTWFVPTAWELEAVTYGTSDNDYAAATN